MSESNGGSLPSQKLTATYKDATKPELQHIFSHDVSQSSELDRADAKSKSKYLSDLRSSTKTLQVEVNAFLTRRMEEDKASAASSTTNKNKAKDEEEEENYGEEKVEED